MRCYEAATGRAAVNSVRSIATLPPVAPQLSRGNSDAQAPRPRAAQLGCKSRSMRVHLTDELGQMLVVVLTPLHSALTAESALRSTRADDSGDAVISARPLAT